MKKCLPALLLLFLITQLHAQTWQWARAGGGVDDTPLTPGPWESSADDMTVDKWGNVYTCGATFNNIQFTGTDSTFPYYGAFNAYIVKYDKCGNFVWAMINGNSAGGENYAIASDSSGNIYVNLVGNADALTPIHIHTTLHTDSLISSGGSFLMKYDPNGNLIWMEPTPLWNAIPQCLKIRSDGKIVGIFQYATPGGTWQSFTVKPVTAGGEALALIQIDPNTGNVLKGALLDTLPYGDQGVITVAGFTMDENDNIYLPLIGEEMIGQASYPGASILGHVFTIPIYAAVLLKIDKNFNLVKYQFDDNSTVTNSVSYSEGALYAGGLEFPYSNYVTDTVGALNNISEFRVYRLDTGTLAPVWVSSPQIYSGSPAETFVVATSKHVYLFGGYTGEIVWGGDTAALSFKQYLFDFDKSTGHFDKYIIDSGSNSNVTTNMIIADAQENLLINGQFSGTFTCGPNTLTPWGGSQSPIFFIEKWGVGCNDTLNTADNPYPPTNLITTTGGTSSIHLQWADNSPYRISFHIYRSPNGVTGWQLVDTALGTQTTLTDTGLASNTWYWYKVVAWNNAGESDPTNIDSAKTLGAVLVTITGPDTLCANSLTGVNYTTNTVAGNTYSWGITGGTITAGGATAGVTVTWNSTGPYKLKITQCTGSNCAADSVTGLTIIPVATSTINKSICPGQSFNGYTTAGTHIDTFTAANGCDSMRTINLTVLPLSYSTITHSICAGQTYLGHNQTGTYTDTLNGSNGCDSIRTLNLTVLNPVTSSITKGICQGFSYAGHSATGTYIDTFTAANTCDSIRTLYLTVSANIQTAISQSICTGHSFDGYNQTGTYTDTFTAVGGCDSIRTLNLTVLNNVTTNIAQSICQGQQYNGHSATGTYTDTFAAANTCDSIRTLHLTVLPISRSTINKSICAGSSYAGYTTGGTYTDTLQAANSCDSIRTLNLTVLPVVTSAISQSICQGQVYNGYSISGTYIDTFNAANGCDSIRTLTLTVSAGIVTTINKSICAGQLYYGYNTTGVYTDTFTAIGGCDSIRTLHLTVNPIYNDTISHAICQGDTFNGHTTAGYYTDTLQSVSGCDSIATVNLTINQPPVVTLSWDSMLAYGRFSGSIGFVITYCNEVNPDTVMLTGGLPSGGSYVGQDIYNNGSQYYITLSGSYTGFDTIAYIVDSAGCAATAYNRVGIEICEAIPQITATSAITLYPNPATDQLFIKAENIQAQSITVYDVNGRIIYNLPFKPVVDVHVLSSGIYFIEINSTQGVARKRFVKM